MVQIVAWKCEEDGKVFEDKKKYQNHLRKLARHRRTRRQLEIEENLKNRIWSELYEREQSIEDWAVMVINNQDLFWAEAAKHDAHDWKIVGQTRKGVVCPVPRLLEFTEFSLRWNDHVSNSHSCPHNGVTNWSPSWNKDKTVPTGYPGWLGRAEWICAWPKEWDGHYLGGDIFSGGTFRTARQRAHIGTGGGGGMRYSEKHKCYVMSHGYDFRIFAADWPGLARYREKQVMWNTLKDKVLA